MASAHLLPTDPAHQHLRCALAAHLEGRGTHTAAAANHLLGGQPAAAARALLAAGGFPAAAAAAEVCARALVSKVSEEKEVQKQRKQCKDIKTVTLKLLHVSVLGGGSCAGACLCG